MYRGMLDMRFESPWAFLLLLFIPFFLDGAIRSRFRKPKDGAGAIRFSSPVDIFAIPRSRRTVCRAKVLSALKLLSFVMFTIALARPQSGNQFSEIEASGRDIILALDVSGSMQALDFFLQDERVDRLTALKFVVKEFIKARVADRIGLVVFGDQAFTQCPLTLDHDILNAFVDSMEIGMAGQGTAIGSALAIALKQIKEIESNSRTVVLVTDGKNNSGAISPLEAAKIAKELNTKVHAIGIGDSGYAPFPVRGIFGGTTLVDRKMEYDEETLKKIASTTEGEYFNAKNTEELKRVYAEIDKLEVRDEKTFEYVDYRERFFPFIVIGLLSFMTHLFLSATVFLKIP